MTLENLTNIMTDHRKSGIFNEQNFEKKAIQQLEHADQIETFLQKYATFLSYRFKKGYATKLNVTPEVASDYAKDIMKLRFYSLLNDVTDDKKYNPWNNALSSYFGYRLEK